MSYIITSGLKNPLTANLDAGGFNITNIGNLAQADNTATIGFYGVEPTGQAAPIPDSTTGSDHSVSINQILTVLRAIGIVAEA